MKVNGVKKEYTPNLSISEMLIQEGFSKGSVAVELNEEIVAKDAYDITILKEEDVVEVVRFMGGG